MDGHEFPWKSVVEEEFSNLAKQLKIDKGPDLFDEFGDVLSGKAEAKWNTLIVNIGSNDRTVYGFHKAIQKFYMK